MATYTQDDLDNLDRVIRATDPGPERTKLIHQAERMAAGLNSQEAADAAAEAKHQRALELEHAKQQTAKIKAHEQRRSKGKPVLQRSSVGRSSSGTKMLGDAVSTAATGAATGLWSATRPGTSRFFWAVGFMGLGTIGMVESMPGTLLESGSAGMLGANSIVLTLDILGMLK